MHVVPPSPEGAGGASARLAHLVTTSIGAALASVREVGTEVGRLAVDLSDAAVLVADRLATVAGRSTRSLLDVTMMELASIDSKHKAQPRATDINAALPNTLLCPWPCLGA
jgi:hypothetical protein